MKVTLLIPRRPLPGQNKQERTYFRHRHEMRKLHADEAAAAWQNAGAPVFAHPKITIRLYYHHPSARGDLDGCFAAIKPLLDGLKRRAWPYDDTRKRFDLAMPEQLVDRVRPRIEIDLEGELATEQEIRSAAEQRARRSAARARKIPGCDRGTPGGVGRGDVRRHSGGAVAGGSALGVASAAPGTAPPRQEGGPVPPDPLRRPGVYRGRATSRSTDPRK